MMKHRNSQSERISFVETFGLRGLGPVLRDASRAVLGRGKVKATQYDASSIKIFKPKISIPVWLGAKPYGRLAPVYNLFNRERPPKHEPFSVKVSFARDFRGGQCTYDSHPGTDFALPVGTPLVACAPGKVILIESRFDHGGLKICLDHGHGLLTTYAHLARALVEEGDTVARGQTVALSGAAGLELFTFFPWVAPHLHLNTILDGVPSDPFAIEENGETALWLNGNNPVPHTGAPDAAFEPTVWNEALIENAIAHCIDEHEQPRLRGIHPIEKRAAAVILAMIFDNTMFSDTPCVYEERHPRRPMLDLPLRAEDYDGIRFVDT